MGLERKNGPFAAAQWCKSPPQMRKNPYLNRSQTERI
jgi:hypothetical protein